MFCRKCGKQINGQGKFCSGCGTPVVAPPEQAPPAQAPSAPQQTPPPPAQRAVQQGTQPLPNPYAPQQATPPQVQQPLRAQQPLPAQEPVPQSSTSNTKLVPILACLLVVLLGGGYLFFFHGEEEPEGTAQTAPSGSSDTGTTSTGSADSDITSSENSSAEEEIGSSSTETDSGTTADSSDSMNTDIVEQTEVVPEVAEPAVPDYIIPNSGTQLLTSADLEGLSYEQLRIARNEIYARHGRIFADEGLVAWFESKTWYQNISPKYSATEFERMNFLSDTEIKNLEVILAAENSANR